MERNNQEDTPSESTSASAASEPMTDVQDLICLTIKTPKEKETVNVSQSASVKDVLIFLLLFLLLQRTEF